ncbi:MAG TPA: SRPBCC domain-containing protein [Xanthobacteraceae bacterium]|nr:SRPBCC domain-containing protein [Xanthobacteraceae bacterium]
MHASAKAAPAAELEFVTSRIIDAPRDLVWTLWTELDHLKQWWGPKGFKVSAATLDLRPGGLFHYGLRAPDGNEMWGKFVFREIVAPERLVFVSSFSDAQGGTTRAPFPGLVWPLHTLSTVTFVDRGARTELLLHGRPLDASREEEASFAGMHESMRGGWGGTFDQLAAHAADMSARQG